jgi:dTDP-4-amino-4,6-dideoxygalactose transaminase
VKRVPLVRLALSDAEVEAAARVIRSGWITQGPEVAAFEAEFAAAVGAPHAVALANCTVALELSLRALGIGPGDEVVTVSHSFVATANVVLAVGARPVFVDVEPDTFGMDPRRLAEALGPRTRAVLCVHQLGIPCDVPRIADLCAARDVPLIEDAACAIGSEVRDAGGWRRIGRPFGRVACFSFHPRKVITTGDGGMITTADGELDRRLRLLRHHGMSVADTVRHESPRVVFEEYVEAGFNGRMTDLQAAVGRPQLQRLDAILGRRRQLAESLAAALDEHRVLAPPLPRADARWNWQSYPARLREPFQDRQRDVLQYLLDHGVVGKRGVTNAHQEPAYAGHDTWRAGPGGLSVSEQLRDTTVLLPLFHAMDHAESAELLSVLRQLHDDYARAV